MFTSDMVRKKAKYYQIYFFYAEKASQSATHSTIVLIPLAAPLQKKILIKKNNIKILNRPGVAGAVLQTPFLLSISVSQSVIICASIY